MRGISIILFGTLALATACDKAQPQGESDLADNVREATQSNTKSSAALGGNNAPADDAGSGVTAQQVAEAGVMLEAGADASCEGATRGCTGAKAE